MNATISVDTDFFKSQMDQAAALLSQSSESVRRNFLDLFLQCVSRVELQIVDAELGTATVASDRVVVYRARIGGDFEELMSALRAAQTERV